MTLNLPDHDRGVIEAGLRWIYDTEQPDGAVLQHHGVVCRSGPVMYGFCPRGFQGLPVVVVTRVGVERNQMGDITNPLTPAELVPIPILLDGLGHPAESFWNAADPNGPRCESGSFGLAHAAHPSLLAAVNRYLAGCPVHGSVFCGTWQDSTHTDCTWRRDGYNLAVKPTWPDLVVPA